jgi:hypothetical protein
MPLVIMCFQMMLRRTAFDFADSGHRCEERSERAVKRDDLRTSRCDLNFSYEPVRTKKRGVKRTAVQLKRAYQRS